MKRSVELLGGGVLGLLLGTVFLATPIASTLSSYARAAWSLAECPPGNYVLASTAQPQGGGQTYHAVTPLRVPTSDVVQVFNDLPTGSYTITGSLKRRDNGRVIATAVQTVSTADLVAAFSRGREPAQPAKGAAKPRAPQPPPSTPSMARTITNAAPAAPVVERPRATIGTAGLREWMLADLIGLSDPALEFGWTRVELVDLDGDALADEVRIESPDGSTIVWRLIHQRLSTRER